MRFRVIILVYLHMDKLDLEKVILLLEI